MPHPKTVNRPGKYKITPGTQCSAVRSLLPNGVHLWGNGVPWMRSTSGA